MAKKTNNLGVREMKCYACGKKVEKNTKQLNQPRQFCQKCLDSQWEKPKRDYEPNWFLDLYCKFADWVNRRVGI